MDGLMLAQLIKTDPALAYIGEATSEEVWRKAGDFSFARQRRRGGIASDLSQAFAWVATLFLGHEGHEEHKGGCRPALSYLCPPCPSWLAPPA